MSIVKPTTREALLSRVAPSHQEDLERAFFARVMMPNGTVKTTQANRLNDLNRAAMPYIFEISDRPVKIMDVGASSGISSIEWRDQITAAGIECELAATDFCLSASLLRFGPGLEVLVDEKTNILHMDVFGNGYSPRALFKHNPFLWALLGLARTFFTVAISLTKKTAGERVTLLSRRFVADRQLKALDDDLLAPNPRPLVGSVHVIRAANVLNRAYFSDQTLSQMLSNLKERLMPGGFLIVCRTDSTGTNNGGIFRLSGARFSPCCQFGRGSEIENMIARI